MTEAAEDAAAIYPVSSDDSKEDAGQNGKDPSDAENSGSEDSDLGKTDADAEGDGNNDDGETAGMKPAARTIRMQVRTIRMQARTIRMQTARMMTAKQLTARMMTAKQLTERPDPGRSAVRPISSITARNWS